MKKMSSPSAATVDFDLRQLEVFCRVVELGSFSRAADAVHLAQASVSERIATLENMVGTRLLDRLGRRVVPTKAGKLLYTHAQALLDMKRTACLEMQGFLGLKQGEIHIGGSTIPGEYILPKVIGRFGEKYSGIRVTLTIADSGEIETRVLAGDFELGVIGSRSSNRNLTIHELWKDELVLAVHAKHRWANRKEVSIEELSEEPFVSREVGSGTIRRVEEHLRAAGSKGIGSLHVVARLGTSTAVKEGVKAGLGVSILSAKALDTELRAGIIKTLKVKDLSMSRSFYVILDRRKHISPLCKAMHDFLVDTAKDKGKGLP